MKFHENEFNSFWFVKSKHQLLIAITLKTLACWRTDMTTTLCTHLATHFAWMPSCFIIFMLPFSAVALALERSTFIPAMVDHRSVLGSYRSADLSLESSRTLPPITYSTSPSTATPCLTLERKITYFVRFYVSLVLMFFCCWQIDFPGNCTFVTVESQFKLAVKQTWRSYEWKQWSESFVSEQGPTAM
jgi:hypothetical protein